VTCRFAAPAPAAAAAAAAALVVEADRVEKAAGVSQEGHELVRGQIIRAQGIARQRVVCEDVPARSKCNPDAINFDGNDIRIWIYFTTPSQINSNKIGSRLTQKYRQSF